MNWYTYFFERAEVSVGEDYPVDALFIALVQGAAEAKYSTKDDLKDLVKAYNDYRKGVGYESITKSISAV